MLNILRDLASRSLKLDCSISRRRGASRNGSVLLPHVSNGIPPRPMSLVVRLVGNHLRRQVREPQPNRKRMVSSSLRQLPNPSESMLAYWSASPHPCWCSSPLRVIGLSSSDVDELLTEFTVGSWGRQWCCLEVGEASLLARLFLCTPFG